MRYHTRPGSGFRSNGFRSGAPRNGASRNDASAGPVNGDFAETKRKLLQPPANGSGDAHPRALLPVAKAGVGDGLFAHVFPPTTNSAQPGPKPDGYSGILEYWQMLRRHPRAIVIAAIVGTAFGFIGTLSEPRIYSSQTTVEIQGMNDNFLNMRELNPNAVTTYLPDYDIQTQVSILTSASLINRVVARMNKPTGTIVPPDRLTAWRKALGLAVPGREELWRQALGTAAGGVRARTSKSTRIVEISCDSTSPELAAGFLNVLTEEYIDQSLETRWKSNEHTGEWLTNQLRDLRVKLEKSQDELQSYASSRGIFVSSDEKTNVNEAKLADLQKELFSAQADRVSKQSRAESAAGLGTDTLSAMLSDSVLQDAESNLEALRRKRGQLSVIYTPNAPQVREVDVQIAELNGTIERQRASLLQRIQSEYQAAARREKLLQDSYEDQAHLVSGETAEVDHYNFLKREVDATRTLYESMLTKLKEASIASELRASNIVVVDKAEVPGAPTQPNVPRKTIMGLLEGLFVGIAYSIVRERADRTLQDPGDASHYLKLPELGVVPVCGFEEVLLGRPSDVVKAAAEAGSDGRALELNSWESKRSLIAEAVRSILLSVMYSGCGSNGSLSLLLTSASPKEGKTTICSNLAIAMAETRRNVLLIDADMRRPRLARVFDVDNSDGLSDLLIGQEPLTWQRVELALRPSTVPGLTILPAGSACGSAATLLYSDRLPELVALLKSHFRTLLFDTPPMANIIDARVIGRHVDGVILVVRSAATTRDAAMRARNRLQEDGTAVVGAVLNAWNPNAPGYSYYRNYYAGYAHYYGERTQTQETATKA